MNTETTAARGTMPLVEADDLPRDVYALLAQANLLRIRGCWEDAVQQCLAALRLAPGSAATQSLLGDIYENQGRSDDAVRWYRMALDTDPNSAANRLKLNRLTQDVQPRRAPSPAQAAARAIGSISTPSVTQLKHPLRDPEKALRFGTLLATIIALLIVAGAYVGLHHHLPLSALGISADQEVKSQPVVVPPAATNAVSSSSDGTAHDTVEQTLLSALQLSPQLHDEGIIVHDVEIDPRSANIAVTFSLLSGTGIAINQETVLRSALRLLQATAAAPSGQTAGLLTGRCLLTPTDSTAAGSAELIFLADIAPTALPATNPPDSGLTISQIQSLFRNIWWSPQFSGS